MAQAFFDHRGCFCWAQPRKQPDQQLHAPKPSSHRTTGSSSSKRQSSGCLCPPIRSIAASNNSRQPSKPASANASQFLTAVELAAISVAAACQAAVLVASALQLRAQHHDSSSVSHPTEEVEAVQHAGDATTSLLQQHHEQQELHIQQQPTTAEGLRQAAVASGGLGHIQSFALLVALMCGVALRQLQRPRFVSAAAPTADAAARLVALEVTSQQQAVQLAAAAKQLDKLQTRLRIATSDVKSPLRAAQGNASAAAAAAAKLAEQQRQLQQQIDGCQELIVALQGLAAKQFKVSTDALQQLKSSQAQLSSSTSKAVQQLQQQQQQLQQLQRQMQQARAGWQQQQQQHGDSSSSSSNSSSVSYTELPPDPWASSHSKSQVLNNGV